ncbi:hypothetical protein F5146DRAFT_1120007 [Armillaria mellea]|nr:hypothetical protein F5146DRAFT_1120007 [Armillaria mellea]
MKGAFKFVGGPPRGTMEAWVGTVHGILAGEEISLLSRQIRYKLLLSSSSTLLILAIEHRKLRLEQPDHHPQRWRGSLSTILVVPLSNRKNKAASCSSVPRDSPRMSALGMTECSSLPDSMERKFYQSPLLKDVESRRSRTLPKFKSWWSAAKDEGNVTIVTLTIDHHDGYAPLSLSCKMIPMSNMKRMLHQMGILRRKSPLTVLLHLTGDNKRDAFPKVLGGTRVSLDSLRWTKPKTALISPGTLKDIVHENTVVDRILRTVVQNSFATLLCEALKLRIAAKLRL